MVLNRVKIRNAVALLFVLVALLFLILYPGNQEKTIYQHNNGKVFGTYYNIQYENDADLQTEIEERLHQFDASLSTFNPQSVISRINRNDTVTTDYYFERMFTQAQNISELSNGAFDITVAPLVNAWGFGFKTKEQVTETLIDSLLEFTGYKKISLTNHQLRKEDLRTMLDASAIAKGYGCDVIGDLLTENGCRNFLVDIGGEIVCKGKNANGTDWKVGVNKPIDDPTNTTNEIQVVLHVSDLSMATSGNYRQFYFENGQKRSHTIDPRTGYPVSHNLLSSTVIAKNCMTADALATACMVIGTDSAMQLISSISNAACFFIYADENGELQTTYSANFEQYLE